MSGRGQAPGWPGHGDGRERGRLVCSKRTCKHTHAHTLRHTSAHLSEDVLAFMRTASCTRVDTHAHARARTHIPRKHRCTGPWVQNAERVPASQTKHVEHVLDVATTDLKDVHTHAHAHTNAGACARDGDTCMYHATLGCVVREPSPTQDRYGVGIGRRSGLSFQERSERSIARWVTQACLARLKIWF